MSSSPCLLGIGEARLGPIPCNELRHAGCMLKSASEQALQALIHVERFCEQLPDNLGEYTATQSAEIQQLTDRVSELELDKDVLEQENHALKEQIEMLKAQVAERCHCIFLSCCTHTLAACVALIDWQIYIHSLHSFVVLFCLRHFLYSCVVFWRLIVYVLL